MKKNRWEWESVYKKRIFIVLMIITILVTIVIIMRQNKITTDDTIELAEVNAGAVSQREGKKIEIFDDNSRKIICN